MLPVYKSQRQHMFTHQSRLTMTMTTLAVVVALAVCWGAVAGGRIRAKTPGCECEADPVDRENCGWKGISQQECENKGCCFNNYKWKTIWCYNKTEPIDLLTNVTCESSTHNPIWMDSDSDSTCYAAFNGDLQPGTDNNEWMSDRESDGAWMRIDFPNMVRISHITMWQRCHAHSQFGRFQLSFSDGSVQEFTTTCQGSSVYWLDCSNVPVEELALDPPVDTMSVTFTGYDDCDSGGNNGIRELAIYGCIV